MVAKTLAAVIVIFACLMIFPVIFGIIGGAFGLVAGIFGAVFAAIGALIAGTFGIIGAIFHWNFFSALLVVLVLILILRPGRK